MLVAKYDYSNEKHYIYIYVYVCVCVCILYWFVLRLLFSVLIVLGTT